MPGTSPRFAAARPSLVFDLDPPTIPAAPLDAVPRLVPAVERPAHSNRAAFNEQATEKVFLSALRYAAQRASMVRRAGGRIDRLYPRELVSDALADTWAGTVAWDSERCSLLDHVRGVIRYRSWQHATGARQLPHVSIDFGETKASREADLALRHASIGSLTPIALSGLARTVVGELRRLAHGDPDVTAVVDAWQHGEIDRADVLRHTGLTEKAYKAARARLSYLLLDLPASLRTTVQDVLRSNQ